MDNNNINNNDTNNNNNGGTGKLIIGKLSEFIGVCPINSDKFIGSDKITRGFIVPEGSTTLGHSASAAESISSVPPSHPGSSLDRLMARIQSQQDEAVPHPDQGLILDIDGVAAAHRDGGLSQSNQGLFTGLIAAQRRGREEVAKKDKARKERKEMRLELTAAQAAIAKADSSLDDSTASSNKSCNKRGATRRSRCRTCSRTSASRLVTSGRA